MLTYFIQKAHNRRVLVIRESSRSAERDPPVEKRAVQDSAYRARASEVFSRRAGHGPRRWRRAAIEEPSGNRWWISGGAPRTSRFISMSGIVYSRSVRVAGNEDGRSGHAVSERKYNLLVGERTAEQIMNGSAYRWKKRLRWK